MPLEHITYQISFHYNSVDSGAGVQQEEHLDG